MGNIVMIYIPVYIFMLKQYKTVREKKINAFRPNPLGWRWRWRDPQLQGSENYSDLTKWRSTVQILLIDVTFYLYQV